MVWKEQNADFMAGMRAATAPVDETGELNSETS